MCMVVYVCVHLPWSRFVTIFSLQWCRWCMCVSSMVCHCLLVLVVVVCALSQCVFVVISSLWWCIVGVQICVQNGVCFVVFSSLWWYIDASGMVCALQSPYPCGGIQIRGGAGISKVVRPLQIKDHLCMCTRGGGLQQAMCSSKNYLWNQNAAIQETS